MSVLYRTCLLVIGILSSTLAISAAFMDAITIKQQIAATLIAILTYMGLDD